MAMEDAEKVERARRMGRAWQCMRCLNEEGKRVVDRKSRIEEHLMKTHLPLTQVPYYCKLCLFRCQKREQLDHHVEVHKRHKTMAEKRNIKDSSVCLVANAKPLVFGPGDYAMLSSEQSLQHFLGFRGTETPSVEAETSSTGSPMLTTQTVGAVQAQPQQPTTRVMGQAQVSSVARNLLASQMQGTTEAGQSMPSPAQL